MHVAKVEQHHSMEGRASDDMSQQRAMIAFVVGDVWISSRIAGGCLAIIALPIAMSDFP